MYTGLLLIMLAICGKISIQDSSPKTLRSSAFLNRRHKVCALFMSESESESVRPARAHCRLRAGVRRLGALLLPNTSPRSSHLPSRSLISHHSMSDIYVLQLILTNKDRWVTERSEKILRYLVRSNCLLPLMDLAQLTA
jgi:hypothetical protein